MYVQLYTQATLLSSIRQQRRTNSPMPPPYGGPLACARGCTVHGTCDALRGVCACPLAYTGDACDRLVLPACSVEGVPLSIRALAHKWEVRVRGAGWLGYVTCECISQLAALRHALLHTSPYFHPLLSAPVHCALVQERSQSVGERAATGCRFRCA